MVRKFYPKSKSIWRTYSCMLQPHADEAVRLDYLGYAHNCEDFAPMVSQIAPVFEIGI